MDSSIQPSRRDWYQFAETASFGLPVGGELVSAGLGLVAPMFLGPDEGPTIQSLLAGVVDSINSWTSQAIADELIKQDLRENLLQVTSRISSLRLHLSEFTAPSGEGLTDEAILRHYENARAKLQNLFEIGSFDLSVALEKLIEPELVHRGLPTFMYGATTAIMISATAIKLDQKIRIAKIVTNTKLTDAQKKHLIAFPTQVPATIATHIRISDDYIQNACNAIHNIIKDWFLSIEFSDAPVNDMKKPDFPFSIEWKPDGLRTRVAIKKKKRGAVDSAPWFGLYNDSLLSPKFIEDYINDQIDIHYGDISIGIRAMQTQRANWCTYLSHQLHSTKVKIGIEPSGLVPFKDFKPDPFTPFSTFKAYTTSVNWMHYPLPPGMGTSEGEPTQDKSTLDVRTPGTGKATGGIVIRLAANPSLVLGVDAPGSKIVLGKDEGAFIWSILSVPGGIGGPFAILNRKTLQTLRWRSTDPNVPGADPSNPQPELDLMPFDPFTTFFDGECLFQRIGSGTRWLHKVIFHKDFASPGVVATQMITPAFAQVNDHSGIVLCPKDDASGVVFKNQEFITSLLTGGAFPAAWIFDSADKDADGLSASGSNGASTGGF